MIDLDKFPDPHCVERMSPVDSMSKEWRDLANEHGAIVTTALRNEGYSLEQATEALETRRFRRQNELLAQDYRLSRKSFVRGTSRRPIPRAFG